MATPSRVTGGFLVAAVIVGACGGGKSAPSAVPETEPAVAPVALVHEDVVTETEPVAEVEVQAEPPRTAERPEGRIRNTHLQVRVRVDFGAVTELGGTGQFDLPSVGRMVRFRHSRFRRCYQKLRAVRLLGGGDISTEFTVEVSGSVSDVRTVADTVGDSALSRCVAAVIGNLRWRQGPRGGSMRYQIPLTFTPGP